MINQIELTFKNHKIKVNVDEIRGKLKFNNSKEGYFLIILENY